MIKEKQLDVFECECERCGHNWITKGRDEPVVCPKCKNPYWNRPKE